MGFYHFAPARSPNGSERNASAAAARRRGSDRARDRAGAAFKSILKTSKIGSSTANWVRAPKRSITCAPLRSTAARLSQAPPVPVRRRNITERFGPILALDGVDFTPGRRDSRDPRPERRRQDHADDIIAGGFAPTPVRIIVRRRYVRIARCRARGGHRRGASEPDAVREMTWEENIALGRFGAKGRRDPARLTMIERSRGARRKRSRPGSVSAAGHRAARR